MATSSPTVAFAVPPRAQIGASDRTRTGTLVTATDFKSVVATITPQRLVGHIITIDNCKDGGFQCHHNDEWYIICVALFHSLHVFCIEHHGSKAIPKELHNAICISKIAQQMKVIGTQIIDAVVIQCIAEIVVQLAARCLDLNDVHLRHWGAEMIMTLLA